MRGLIEVGDEMTRKDELLRLLAQVQERNYRICDVDPRLWVRQIEEICQRSEFGTQDDEVR